jgi:hypothetical protein
MSFLPDNFSYELKKNKTERTIKWY